MEENFVSPMTSGKVPEDLTTLSTTAAADYPTDVTPFASSTLNEGSTITPALTAIPPGLSFKDLPLTLPRQQTIENSLLSLTITEPKVKVPANQLPNLLIADEIDEEQEIAKELEVIDPFACAPRLPKGAIKLGKVLGHGAFGEVYQGDWQGRPVALKKIDLAHAKKSLPQLDETQILESLQWEVSRLSTVSHPQLVSFYGIYESDNVIYLAMEFCPGGDLQKRLAKGNVSWAKRWQWALEISQGLSYLHEQGVLHRDLKAENVLLDANDRAKLADLGVAQVDELLQDKEAQIVVEGLQDKKFIAPENIKNPTLSSKETDVYALGLVFWQLVVGQVPRRFIELSKEEYQAWYFGKGLREPIPSDCPKSFRQLILACWAHEPNQRIKLSTLCEQLKQLAVEFHPYPQEVILLESLDSLLHPKRSAGLTYVPSMVTQYPVNEPLDTYWRRWESSPLPEEEAKFRNPPLKLADALEHFLQQPGGGTLLLLGESGLGKTLSVYQWANQLLNQAWAYCGEKTKQPQGYLPLLVRPALNQWTQAGLKDGLAKTLAFYGLPQNTVLPLLLILDGYDECIGGSISTNLAEQLGLPAQSPIKLVVTCRPETVSSHELHQHFASSGQLQTCYFLPFSLDQLFHYMAKQLLWEEKIQQTYQNALANNTMLCTVLRNPFVLSLYVESWPIISKKNVTYLDRGQIYENFVEHVLATHSSLLSSTVKRQVCAGEASLLASFDRTASKVAFKLFQTKASIFTQALAELGESSWLMLESCVAKDSQRRFALRQKALAAKENQSQAARRSLLSEADYVAIQLWRSQQFQQYLPLKHKAFGYEFSHKSFLEYFAARQLMLLSKSNDPKAEGLTLLNIRSLRDEPEILNFWVEGWHKLPTRALTEPLFEIVQVSRNDVSWAQAASNAATLLARAGVPFSEKDFSGVSIRGADLQNTVFTQSSFKGADLSGANLKGSLLEHTDFTGADLSGVSFGEYPSLRFEGPISCLARSLDGRWLAIAICMGKKHKIKILFDREGTNEFKEMGETKKKLSVLSQVVFSPDGKMFLSVSEEDCNVRLWDKETFRAIGELKGHTKGIMDVATKGVMSVAFSPDGTLIATGGRDGKVWLWDAIDQKVITKLVHKGHYKIMDPNLDNPEKMRWEEEIVFSVDFHPSEKMLAAGGNMAASHGTELGFLLRGAAHSVNYSAIGREAAVHLWDINTYDLIGELEGHTAPILKVLFSPDGKILASGSEDGTVRLWDAASQQKIGKLHHGSVPIYHLAFSPDGERLASAGRLSSDLYLWDVTSQQMISHMQGHKALLSGLVFNFDGKILMSGSLEGSLRLWDIASQQVLAGVIAHKACIYKVTFSPDGKTLASGGDDGIVCFWDVEKRKALGGLWEHPCGIEDIMFSPDGKILAVSDVSGGSVHLWDVANRRGIRTLKGKLKDNDSIMGNVIFSPDGKVVASSGGQEEVDLWNVESQQIIGKLDLRTGHTDYIWKIAFSPDGKFLASASEDCTIAVWDITSFEIVNILTGHTGPVTSIAFRKDGVLASASLDKTIHLWGIKKHSIKMQGNPGFLASLGYQDIVFSPDGNTLVSTGEKLILWSVPSKRLIAEFGGHESFVFSAAFSPDGMMLASGGMDCTIILWARTINASAASFVCEEWHPMHRFAKHASLIATDAYLKGAKISNKNLKLLQQAGANNPDISYADKKYQMGLNHFKKSHASDAEKKIAIHYFRLAADQIHPNACYQLGNCYKKGYGVDKNYKEAAKYYQLALLQNHKKAKRKQKRLLKRHPEFRYYVSTLTILSPLPPKDKKQFSQLMASNGENFTTSPASVHLFTGFFTAHSALSEGGKQVVSYLSHRDRQSMACLNQSSYQFFRQPLPPSPRPTLPSPSMRSSTVTKSHKGESFLRI